MLRFKRQRISLDTASNIDVETRLQLDGLVVNTELTLISIIQGVALYFLTDSSRNLLVTMQLSYWPYILVGLLTIFLFWSRSLIHTFTVIRWPIEFGHNFLYIACTLVEAAMFTQIANPNNWFLLGAGYGTFVWILFIYDLGMIRRRGRELDGRNAEMCRKLERDQLMNIRVIMPVLIAFHLGAYAALRFWPDLFIGGSLHLALGIVQTLGGLVYLAYVLRFFRGIAPGIVRWRAVEREELVADAVEGDERTRRHMPVIRNERSE